MSKTPSRKQSENGLVCLIFLRRRRIFRRLPPSRVSYVCCNRIHASAASTYRLNYEKHGTKFVLGDISDARVQEELFDAVGGVELDAIIGGPPCQGFSQVRNHNRLIEDPRKQARTGSTSPSFGGCVRACLSWKMFLGSRI